MAVYTDNVHIVSDVGLDELHAFANEIGLKRCWFEGVKKKHPHYDLTNDKNVPLVCKMTGKKFIEKAVENGAIVVRRRKIKEICIKLYGNFVRKKPFKIVNNDTDENNQTSIPFNG